MKLLRMLRNFSTVVFLPTSDDLSGAYAQDLAYSSIYASLLSSLFGFADTNQVIQYGAVPTGDGPAEYNTAYYAHTYDWQLPGSITYQDGFLQYPDVAFRDIVATFELFSDAEAEMIVEIDLDEEHLPEFGPELLINGAFDADTDWIKTAQVTISGGELHLVSNDGSFQKAEQSVAGESLDGKTFRVAVIQTAVPSGQIKIGFPGDLVAHLVPAIVGTQILTFVNGGSVNTFQISRVSGITDIDVSSISLREVL